jgi:hypothetical protein
MKKIFLFVTILIVNINLFSQETFQYISPVNNAKLVSLKTNIILRAKEKIDLPALVSNIIKVQGEKSGKHQGKVKLSDDGKTLIFIPVNQFEPNEEVRVNSPSGIKTIKGDNFLPVSIQFSTTPLSKPIVLDPFSTIDDKLTGKKLLNKSLFHSSESLDSLPQDFPQITIDSINNPASGKIFLANFPFGVQDSLGSFLMIVNNDGTVENYKRIVNSGFDFKVQPNGNLSYAEVIQNFGGYADVRWIVLDTSLTPVDTFKCGNGYNADLHEFKLLPNGHAVLIAYDPQPVDMSGEGGDPNALVLGAIIQELDASKNVIFQWRSWDYLNITDTYANLTDATVDYVHINALDTDSDRNFLMSARHMSQIVKIDRETGNIIWRLGGKSNEFTFVNENEDNSPNYFSYQHNISVLPGGNITLFDNGNQHPNQYSRGVEYRLNEQTKTATMVWEYRHSPDIYGFAMGTMQRLPDGNSLIGWGAAGQNGSPALTEVHPDGSVAFELSFPAGQTSYRAFRFLWKSLLPSATVTQFEILEGNTYNFDEQGDTTGISIKFNQLDAFIYNSVTATVFNYAPEDAVFSSDAPKVVEEYFSLMGSSINSFKGEVSLKIQHYPGIINPQNTIVYLRAQSGNNFEPLPTSFNASENELTFTASEFGDFIFCEPLDIDSVYSPILIEPEDDEIVNVETPTELIWGTRGIVSGYQLQVSLDSLFNSPIIDNAISSTSYEIDKLTNDSKYFWRVRTSNSSGESDWSETNSFLTSSPFIEILSPNGNENFYQDSSYIIRWQDNLSGMVRINLLRDDTVTAVVGDSLVSETNAFQWQVPSSIEKDSTYKIKISDLNNESLFDLSDNNFIINENITGVEEDIKVVKDYRLYQNYPNPFNPSTTIKYTLLKESRVTISIFNTLGERVAVLNDEVQKSGSHSIVWNARNLSSGVYFYEMKAVSINEKNSFTFHKKAVLIK